MTHTELQRAYGNLVGAVEKMRYFQKEYISTRDKYTLFECKRLEREVDNLLTHHYNESN